MHNTIEMTKENFLDKWIEALPLNSKDADRKEMAYDIDLMIQNQNLSEQLKAFLDFVDIRYRDAGTRDKIVDEFLEFYVDLNDVSHSMTGDGMNSLEFFDMIKREWCVSEEQWKPFWNDVLTFAIKYHQERKEYCG